MGSTPSLRSFRIAGLRLFFRGISVYSFTANTNVPDLVAIQQFSPIRQCSTLFTTLDSRIRNFAPSGNKPRSVPLGMERIFTPVEVVTFPTGVVGIGGRRASGGIEKRGNNSLLT